MNDLALRTRPTPADELAALAETIRYEIEAAIRAAESALEHAVLAGEALIVAKDLVPAGEWMRWLAAALPDGKRRSSCQNYMRLAAHKQHLDPTLAIRSNLQLIRGLPARPSSTPRYPPEVKARALQLVEEGYNHKQVGELVGVTDDTVHSWADPEWARYNQARSRALSKRRNAERLEQERIAEGLPKPDERTTRYGEPGRAAVGLAVRRLAQVQGKNATREALLDLVAIAQAWAERLSPSEEIAA